MKLGEVSVARASTIITSAVMVTLVAGVLVTYNRTNSNQENLKIEAKRPEFIYKYENLELKKNYDDYIVTLDYNKGKDKSMHYSTLLIKSKNSDRTIACCDLDIDENEETIREIILNSIERSEEGLKSKQDFEILKKEYNEEM